MICALFFPSLSLSISFCSVSIFSRGEMSAKKAHRLWDRRLNVSFDGDTSHYLQQNTIPATFAIFSHSKGAHQHYYYNIVCSIFILESRKIYQKNSKDSGNSINSNINILHTTNRVLNLVSSKCINHLTRDCFKNQTKISP